MNVLLGYAIIIRDKDGAERYASPLIVYPKRADTRATKAELRKQGYTAVERSVAVEQAA